MDEKRKVDEAIRQLPAEGFIRFSIKANDTAENQAIHDGFKEFARVECDDNYTLALKRLLEDYQGTAKFDVLYELIKALENDFISFKNSLKNKEPEEKEKGMF